MYDDNIILNNLYSSYVGIIIETFHAAAHVDVIRIIKEEQNSID